MPTSAVFRRGARGAARARAPAQGVALGRGGRFPARVLAFLLLTVALFLAAPTARAEPARPYLLGLGVRYWAPTDSGAALGRGAGVPGSRLSFDRDLNMEDRARALEFTLDYRPSVISEIELSYFSLGLSGAGLLPRPLHFEGVTFPAGDLADSDLDFSLARLSYFHGLPLDKADAGVIVGVSMADASFDLTSLSGGVGGISLGWRAPVLGAAMSIPFGLAGLPLRLSFSFLAHLPALLAQRGLGVELHAAVEWRFWDKFGVEAGVKYLNVEMESRRSGSLQQIDATFFGPYAALRLRF
ncbi:MAG: hypothetical protein HY719_15605 [Planctomycetes bacterium]|nr:hypothetical protein [Planctomycetota bacterium]